MRSATVRAASRRGCVCPIIPWTPRPSSMQILGSWVVFPDPVSPATITTWWSRMAAAISSRRSATGRSGYLIGSSAARPDSRRAGRSGESVLERRARPAIRRTTVGGGRVASWPVGWLAGCRCTAAPFVGGVSESPESGPPGAGGGAAPMSEYLILIYGDEQAYAATDDAFDQQLM